MIIKPKCLLWVIFFAFLANEVHAQGIKKVYAFKQPFVPGNIPSVDTFKQGDDSYNYYYTFLEVFGKNKIDVQTVWVNNICYTVATEIIKTPHKIMQEKNGNNSSEVVIPKTRNNVVAIYLKTVDYTKVKPKFLNKVPLSIAYKYKGKLHYKKVYSFKLLNPIMYQ
jgi:hypothetical protein